MTMQITTRRRPRLHSHRYSLPEVLLATVIMVCGLLGVAGVMPISQKATRSAVGNIGAADAGDQLLRLLASKMKTNWEITTAIPINRPGDDESGLTFSTLDSSGVFHTVSGLSIQYDDKDQDGEFDIDADGGDVDNSGILRIDHVTDDNITDFSAIVRVWRSPDSYCKFNALTGQNEVVPIPASSGLRLHLELSFPAELPYAQREKRRFAISVSRPLENPPTGYYIASSSENINFNMPDGANIYAAINVNPSNGNDNDFVAHFMDGTTVSRSDLSGVKKQDLDSNGVYKNTRAISLWFRPSGNGDGNKLTVNGSPIPLDNGSIYHISGQRLTVRLQNTEDGSKNSGGGMGDWWMYVYCQDGVLTRID